MGLGASTMFGLVATMGVAQLQAESTTSSTGAAVATVSPPAPATPATPLTIVPVPALPAVPASTPAGAIVLQARPDVRVVAPAANVAAPAPAPAPVATTRGSN
jgi:hypothetical protein